MSKTKSLKILAIITTLFTLIVNALATLLPINGQTTAEISDKFNVFFVPAGYVFSIWGLIYILMLGYSIYQLALSAPFHNRIRLMFIISNLLNALWILAWHYNQYALSGIVMTLLLLTLITIYRYIRETKFIDLPKLIFVKTTFSVYLGWISVATIANFTVILEVLKWGRFGQAPLMWAIIMIVVAGILGSIFYLRERDIFFVSVIVWALIGIGVKFQFSNEITFSVAIAIGLMVLSFVKKEFWVQRKKMLIKKI